MSVENHPISLVGACAWFVALKSHAWVLCSSSRSCQKYQWIDLVRAKHFGYYIHLMRFSRATKPVVLPCQVAWGTFGSYIMQDAMKHVIGGGGYTATRYRFHSCSTKIPRLFAHIHIIRVMWHKHHKTNRLSLPFQHWQDLLWFANVRTHTYTYTYIIIIRIIIITTIITIIVIMIIITTTIIEGSLEVKLPTIWTVEKQRWEESAEKDQKKEDADARKGRKVAIHCVFPMICGSGGSKSRLAKAAGAEPAGQMRDEKLHAVVARSTFPSKNGQNTSGRTTFGSWDVEKVHAIVARSAFPSKNGQNTRGADHFWKLRCRKSARHCGAKHISKSKFTKHTNLGPLLEVAMSKKCTPLWREAHFQVKSVKNWRSRTTFWRSDVEFPRSARRCGAKQISKSKCTKTPGVRTTFGGWDVEFRKSARRCGAKHIWKLKC